MRHFEITTNEDGHVAVLHETMPGSIGSPGELREEFDRLAAVAPPLLVISMEEVVTTDGGLRGLLVGLRKKLHQRKGELVLTRLTPHVVEELRLVRLLEYFEVTRTCEEALALLRRQRSENGC